MDNFEEPGPILPDTAGLKGFILAEYRSTRSTDESALFINLSQVAS